jgi:uncharacterized small protein (DUF1192 family)
MMKRIGELKAENARLKADVNELADGLKLASEVGIKMADEVTRLKAEVERLGAENSHLHKGIYSLSLNVGQLKDEVERLTKQAKGMSKAGWSLVNAHQYDASISYWNKCINDWQNADKGVQS